MTTIDQDQTTLHNKNRVAKILLEHGRDRTNGNNRLARRDIAEMLGTSFLTVHFALESLMQDGAIKIERNRIILNKEMILKLVEIN
jgi:DNA-binding GntR family transcriptional regulator